jgi:hypothetical protein
MNKASRGPAQAVELVKLTSNCEPEDSGFAIDSPCATTCRRTARQPKAWSRFRRRCRCSSDPCIEGFVAGLVALESRAVETEAGERPLGVTVKNDLRARILMGALTVAPCG